MGRCRPPAGGDLRAGVGVKILRWWRVFVPLLLLGVAISLIWWRGPDWHAVRDSFTVVRWPWVAAAIGLNLVSVARARGGVEHVDQAGDARAAPRLPSCLLGVLRRPLRQCRACQAASASSRASPCLTRRMPGRRGCLGDADRHGLRASHVRPLPRDRARSCGCCFAAKLPQLGADDASSSCSATGLALFVFAWLSARVATRPSTSRWRRDAPDAAHDARASGSA